MYEVSLFVKKMCLITYIEKSGIKVLQSAVTPFSYVRVKRWIRKLKHTSTAPCSRILAPAVLLDAKDVLGLSSNHPNCELN